MRIDKNSSYSQRDLMGNVARYLVDVGVTDENVTAFNVILACEYVYQPTPRFWRDFDVPLMFELIAERFPGWGGSVEAGGASKAEVAAEICGVLKDHAYCEELAEILMSVSTMARPTGASEAYRLMRKVLDKRQRRELLGYLQDAGDWALEQAFDVVACLESVDTDRLYERNGTVAARNLLSRSHSHRA